MLLKPLAEAQGLLGAQANKPQQATTNKPPNKDEPSYG